MYRNYYKEQASRIMLKNGILQKGTYYEDDIAYIFAGIKKGEEGRLNYKDKFINNKIFQWESIANVSESEKEHLRNSKKVHLFIRKMKSEDKVTLPYTYFGLGTFTNERDSYTEEDEKIKNECISKGYHLENKTYCDEDGCMTQDMWCKDDGSCIGSCN